MEFSESNKEVSLTELHGTQLRVATDTFVEGVNDLEIRTEFLLRRVQAMVNAGAVRIAVQDNLESSQLGV